MVELVKLRDRQILSLRDARAMRALRGPEVHEAGRVISLRKTRMGKSLRQVTAWLNMPTMWPQIVSNSDAFRRISGFKMGPGPQGCAGVTAGMVGEGCDSWTWLALVPNKSG